MQYFMRQKTHISLQIQSEAFARAKTGESRPYFGSPYRARPVEIANNYPKNEQLLARKE